MKDYICIGSAPSGEPCAQLGQPDYYEKALTECWRLVQLLRRTCGPEPAGARLAVKWFPHEFGDYCEVVCHYTPDIPESVDYALRCEAERPVTWEDTTDTPSGGSLR